MNDVNKLCDLAKEAMLNAYAPYSNYMVGAALLCEDGSVYTGCNIENAGYSATICAERTAIFKAVSECKKKFTDIAVCGGKNGELNPFPYPPCGICRQVMREFCSGDFRIHMITSKGYQTYTLDELLPHGFGPEHIEK